ncbi:hypothetical protein [Reyranella sp.]|uniref:hypothetical protein n=1 Tax=Reyranella sp. TaxID=1929291 RepID=UPI003D120DE7
MSDGTDLAVTEQSPAGGAELAEIQHTLRHAPAEYWRNRDMQARHLGLLPSDGSPAHRARGVAPAAPADDGEAVQLTIPGTATSLQAAAGRGANGVLANLPPSAGASLESSFNSLPVGVVNACREELAAPCPKFAPPADDAFLARFAASPRGRELAREWGSIAAVRLGRVQARMDRWFDRMANDADRKTAGAWFRGLPANQASAIFRALSA